MHENSGNSVIYYAHYTTDGVGTTGLTVTITVYEVIRDGTKTEVVTDGACTEIGDGLYRYLLASGTVDAAAEYVAVFHTATDTVDAQDIPAMWVIDRAGTEKLDTGITLADDAITAGKFDESTAYPLKSADTGATQVARVGADSDTLETLSDQLDVVQTDLDNPAQYKADVSGLALEATLTAIKGAGWTTQQTLSYIATTMVTEGFFDDMSSGIYEIQNDLVNGGRIDLLIDSIIAHLVAIKGAGWTNQTLVKIVTDIAAIQAGSGATAQEVWEYATRVLTAGTNIDLSALATATDLATVDTVVDAIKAKTDNLPADPAAVGSAMTLTAAYDKAKDDVLTPLGVVDGIVDAIKAKTDNLSATPASAGEYTSALTAIQNDLDNPSQYKADVSNLALQATSLAIKGQTDKIPAAPAQTGEYNAALAAIQSDLDNPNQYKADVSGLATQASVNAIPTTPLLAANYVAPDNAGIAAIKAKTDLIPATPAQAGEYTSALSAIQADLDNPSQYKADVSGLATSSALATVDTVVDGIATTLANPDNFKADVSALALESTLTAMKGAGWSTETLAAIKSAIDALSSGGVDPAVIAAAILDALLADHTVAGSVAKTIADILEDTGTTLSNLITSIKAKTDLMDASAITYTPNVVGTAITLLRGDTFSATLTDVGALTGYVSIDFTVKRNTSNTDDEAVIRIRKNASGTGDGLLRLNRAAPTTETGEIVIDDEATGDITITLDETATDGLEVGAYLYDVQLITATAVKTLTSGRLNVTSDVTRAIA